MVKTINKRIILGIIIIAAIASAGIISVVMIFLPDVYLDSRVIGLMSQGDIPSLAAGIVINDTLVWSKGYGEQPDLDTVYMIGSITKIFTATAIMQLYDNGMLDLDADINNYIPFSVRNPSYSSVQITTRMLLTHKSGINHGVIDEILWDWDADMINWQNEIMGWNFTPWDPRPTLGDFLNGSLNPSGPYYAPENWDSRPDSRRQYSNTAFLLLSYIVEQLTNQSFSEYLQENVLDPLDMTSTGYNYTDFIGRNAIPYELRNNTNEAYPIYNNYNLGGGALRSTVPDLANFLIAHMNRGSYNSTQILLPQTVDLMQTVAFPIFGQELGGFQNYGQGLGWFLFQDNITGHGGAIHGFLAQIAFKTANNGKYGIVLIVNRGVTLVEDDFLLNTFFPSMIDLLFDEVARLQQFYHLCENPAGIYSSCYFLLVVNCQQLMKRFFLWQLQP